MIKVYVPRRPSSRIFAVVNGRFPVADGSSVGPARPMHRSDNIGKRGLTTFGFRFVKRAAGSEA